MYSYDGNNGDMHGEASHTEEIYLMFWNGDLFISVIFKLYVNFYRIDFMFIWQFNNLTKFQI